MRPESLRPFRSSGADVRGFVTFITVVVVVVVLRTVVTTFNLVRTTCIIFILALLLLTRTTLLLLTLVLTVTLSRVFLSVLVDPSVGFLISVIITILPTIQNVPLTPLIQHLDHPCCLLSVSLFVHCNIFSPLVEVFFRNRRVVRAVLIAIIPMRPSLFLQC